MAGGAGQVAGARGLGVAVTRPRASCVFTLFHSVSDPCGVNPGVSLSESKRFLGSLSCSITAWGAGVGTRPLPISRISKSDALSPSQDLFGLQRAPSPLWSGSRLTKGRLAGDYLGFLSLQALLRVPLTFPQRQFLVARGRDQTGHPGREV